MRHDPSRLPGPTPVVRITESEDKMVFTLGDGRTIVKRADEFYNWLYQGDNIPVIRRITPQFSEGDIIRYRRGNGVTGTGVALTGKTGSRGTYVDLRAISENPNDNGLDVSIDVEEIVSVTKGEGPPPKRESPRASRYVVTVLGGQSKHEKMRATKGYRAYSHLSSSEVDTLVQRLQQRGVRKQDIVVAPIVTERRVQGILATFDLRATRFGRLVLDVGRLVLPGIRHRRCVNAYGNPKRIFETLQAAREEIPNPNLPEPVQAYFCRRHQGYHLGRKR